jgi:hypothetical protein
VRDLRAATGLTARFDEVRVADIFFSSFELVQRRITTSASILPVFITRV